jgi:hypothetical protein
MAVLLSSLTKLEYVKKDAIREVNQFFLTGIMPGDVNDTYIVLIPKIYNPIELKDFHPFSYVMCSTKCA